MSIADPAPFTDEPHAPQSPETTDDRFVPKPVTPQEQADFNYWTKSFKYLLNIGLTEAEKQEYQEFADRKFYFAKKERCEKWRNQALKTSPAVIFMMQNLDRIQCPITLDRLKCVPCAGRQAGGIVPQAGIVLCQNKIFGKRHMEDTLVHEMMHVYDMCRFHVDWGNLKHHACSEIRAMTLSGECKWSREFFERKQVSFVKQHQNCVKRRAFQALRNNPNCKSDEEASRTIEQVFDSCFHDTRPFDEIY